MIEQLLCYYGKFTFERLGWHFLRVKVNNDVGEIVNVTLDRQDIDQLISALMVARIELEEMEQ